MEIYLKSHQNDILSILEEENKKEFLMNNPILDIYSPIRKALLGKDCGVFVDLETSLVIATLDPAPLGKVESDNGIVYLPTSKLTGVSIVDNWWLGTGFTGLEKLKLIVIATLLSPIPRLVEFGGDFLEIEIKKSTIPLKCDSIFLGKMFEYIDTRIDERFGRNVPTFTACDQLYNITYGLPIDFNTAKVFVRGSLITNSLDTEDKLIDPKVSIQVLLRSLKKTYGLSGQITMVTKSLENILKAIKTIDKFSEHPPDVFFKEWFNIRYFVALNNPNKFMSTATLLGLDSLDPCLFSANTLSLLHMKIPIPDVPNYQPFYEMKKRLYQKSPSITKDKLFYDIIIGQFPTIADPVKLLTCVGGDHQDFVLMIYSKDPLKPLIYGLDTKPRNEVGFLPGVPIDANLFPSSNHLKWEAFCKTYSLPFGFIYLTTHEGTSYDKDGVIVLRRDVVSNFFVSLWDTYLATRNVVNFSDPQASKKL